MAANYGELIDEINKMSQEEKIYLSAINTVMAAQKKRIFQEGKSASEAKIGEYGTKPISIAKKNQAKNTGKTYFKGGYREYKSLVGKGSSFVNLRNKDQMMIDLGTTIVGPKEYGIGFQNEINGSKKEWMEKKYSKDIFGTTEAEDNLFISVIEFEINKL